jgi:hypothetical protein
MVVQAELQASAARQAEPLARLVRMASTVTEVWQAMAATVARALTERRELME